MNVPSVTDSSKIRVTFGSPLPSSGGSSILSYNVEIDDGYSGPFRSIIGKDSNSLLTTVTISDNILKGKTYRVRYQAKNAIGWGEYSSEETILAASRPSIPSKPTFNKFLSSTLYLNLFKSPDNGGSPITKYELFRDAGDDFSSTFVSIQDINPDTLSFSAADNTLGLNIGKTYRFKVKAHNVIGASEYSDEAYIAFGNVPGIPTAVVKSDKTSRTSITVSWSAVISTLPVTGYVVNIDDGKNG